MNTLLTVKAWLAKYGWYVVAGALIIATAFMFTKRRRPEAPMADSPLAKAAAHAIAQAEAAHVEVTVRKQVAGEKAAEQMKELDAAKAEPDPVVRRKKLASMLTSWGS